MAWVKIDDQFADHPKAAEAGPLGIAMQVAALCYANRHLTDGFISNAVSVRLLDFSGIAEEIPNDHDLDDSHVEAFRINWLWVIEKLVNAGLWEEVDGGWQIHDYLDYNPSRADTLAKRAADLERKRPPQRPANSARIPTGIHQDSKRPVPGPVPDPPKAIREERLTLSVEGEVQEGGEPPPAEAETVESGPVMVHAAPKPPKGPPTRLLALFESQFWPAWPKKVGKQEALSAFVKVHPTEEDVGRMVTAIPAQSAALDWPRDNFRYCPHPAKWLAQRRWDDEPPQETTHEATGRNGQGRRNRFGYQAERLTVGIAGSHGAGGTDSWSTGPPVRTGGGT